MDQFLVNSGYGALIVFANSLVAKLGMSVIFRLKQIRMSGKESSKLEETPEYKHASRTQLNDAEYSPLIIGGLLYLHSKGIQAPIASSLLAFGSVAWYWGRMFGGIKFSPLGAVPRYVGLAFLGYEIYKTL